MKLISTTEKVLELQNQLKRCIEQEMPFTDLQALKQEIQTKIFKHANLLSQKLELWIFVPCKLVNGVWIVLEDPDNKTYTVGEVVPNETNYCKLLKEYQEAKERVLFEGWKYKKDYMGFKIVYNKDFKINLDTLYCEFYIDGMHYEDFKLKGNDIKSLSNQLSNIILTPTAQKQIGI